MLSPIQQGLEVTSALKAHSKRFTKRLQRMNIVERNPFVVVTSVLFIIPVDVGLKNIQLFMNWCNNARKLWQFETEFEQQMDILWLELDTMMQTLKNEVDVTLSNAIQLALYKTLT